MRHSFVGITASVCGDTSVADVLRIMGGSQPQLPCVFVADGANLEGIFTERDLLSLVVQGRSLSDLPIATVMRSPVVTVRQADLGDLSMLMQQLEQHSTDHLAVLDDRGVLVGVITRERLQPHLWEVLQEQQALAASLSNREQQYQSLIQALPDLIMRTSAEGIYLDCVLSPSSNVHCGNVFLPGKRLDEILPSELATLRLRHIQQALQTGDLQIYEQQIVINDSLRTEEVRINPCATNEVLVVVRDITEHKALEATNRAIVEAIPDLLVRINRQGQYLGILSGGSVKKVLLPPSTSFSYTVYDVLPQPLAAQKVRMARQAIETGAVQVYEHQLEIEGELYWEEVRASSINGDDVLFVIRDISERKRSEAERDQAERALALSEATNRAILAAIPDLLVRVSAEGQYLDFISPDRSFNVFASALAMPNGTIPELLPPEVAQLQMAAIRRALETRELQVHEQQIQVGDRLQYEELRAIAISATEVLLIIRDISDRRRAEVALQALNRELEERVAQRTAALGESEERWQLAIQGSNASLWDLNLITGEVFRTERWKELRGLSTLEDASQTAWLNGIHPDDRDRVLAAFNAHLARKTPFYEAEYRIRHQAGHYLWILDRGQACWDDSGNPVRIIGSETNIDRRKQAEEQLLKNEAHLAAAQRVARLGSWEFNPHTYAIDWSAETYRIFGRAAEAGPPTFAEFLAYIHADDRAAIEQKTQAVIDQNQPFEAEYRLYHPDGSLHYVLSRAELVHRETGQPLALVGTVLDISEIKRVEAQLRYSQAALAEAQRMVHLGSWELDVLTQKLTWSDELFRILGFDPSNPEPAYAEHFNYFPPEDRDRMQQYLDRAMQEGIPYEVEVRFLRPNGTLVYLEARGNVKRNAQGQVVKLFGTALDITDRKLAELERQKLSERLSLALNSGAIGCWEWDIQQNTILWDERMYELYGLSKADFGPDADASWAYQFWADKVHPDDLEAAEVLLQQTVLGQATYDPEFRVVHSDGSIHHIKAYGKVRCDGDGHPKSMIGVNLDISERKQVEERLQHINERLVLTNAELDRATRLKDEFLASMSHELRTPLNAILGMAEGLKEHVFGPINDRQSQALSTIERSGLHLLDLINDILDLSKVEAGKLELEPVALNVKQLCESSLSFVRQIAFSKNVGLSLESLRPIPDIAVDERRIRQVLINLLSNAVKFTPAGGQVTLTAEVEPQGPASAVNNWLKLSVTDTGIGIAPDNIAKLFQPFVQIDSSLSRQYTGTGLGLALVRKIVELHGGSVSVTSEVDQGSCFTVTLPYLSETGLDATVSPTAPAQPLDANNTCVLVIEDSVEAAGILARYLQEQGLDAIVCPSGDRVMQEAVQAQPALIILDILLPDRSGWDVLRQLKASPQTQAIPVIVVSVVDERSYGLSLGASDYLVKPITRQQLQQTLESLQQRHPAPLSPALIVSLPDPTHQAVDRPLILLAEDNDMNVATISSFLTASGYRLIYAKSGQEAVELTQTQAPDLILMDIQMPGMDGLQAMQLIRSDARFATLPIIALTALAMPGDRERCLEAGANQYLPKPVKMKELKALIQQLLAF
ncbi:PAS domain-containing protein [Nodosilinea sp. LEGE 06152]|uniref:PAS domain-containing protein n=1 Tax=Nodosilinea sp. LEGE 06152 TaxID=2777966 RepID=UPI001D15940A|nr:PAS domain-containing protein [Nodosilinea sp. LEGE 06152]